MCQQSPREFPIQDQEASPVWDCCHTIHNRNIWVLCLHACTKGAFNAKETYPTAIDPSTKDNIISCVQWVTRMVKITKKERDGLLEETNAKTQHWRRQMHPLKNLLTSLRTMSTNWPFMCITSNTSSRGWSLTKKEVAIHIDYSKNYSCKYTREVKTPTLAVGTSKWHFILGSNSWVGNVWSLLPLFQHL